MKFNYPYLLSIFLVGLIPITLTSQESADNSPLKDLGLPYMQEYSTRDYQANTSNWCVAMGKSGRILIGNSEGLLSFDGVKWKLYPIPAGTVLRSLALDEQGQVYYGAKDDFGYLSSDSLGNLQLISIKQALPEEIGDFRDIWELQVLGDKVYFQSYKYIFQFRKNGDSPSKLEFEHVIESDKSILSFSKFGSELLVYVLGKGLLSLDGQELNMTPVGDFFATKSIKKIIPYWDAPTDRSLLICTNKNGLFHWDRETNDISLLQGNYLPLFQQARLHNAIQLKNGNLAVATSKGLFLLDQQAKLLQVFDKDKGLPSNVVLSILEDRQGGLWTTTNNGIVRMEASSGLTRYAELQGLNQYVRTINKHQGRLYIGTDNGLFISPGQGSTKFTKIAGLNHAVFSILATGDELLVASPYSGIYQLRENRLIKLFDKNLPLKLTQSRFDKNLVFVGFGSSYFGFGLMYKSPVGWKLILTNPIVKEEIRYVEEESHGLIWLGSRGNGFIRLEIPNLRELSKRTFSNQLFGDSIVVEAKRYPQVLKASDFRARVHNLHDKVYFPSNKGLKRISYEENDLVQDSSLGELFADTLTGLNHIIAGKQGQYWVNCVPAGDEQVSIMRLAPNANNSYVAEEELPLRRTFETRFNTMFNTAEEPNVLWFGTPNGLLRYDAEVPYRQLTTFTTLITSVLSNGDSTIYGGFDLNPESVFREPNLAYTNNALRFEFATTNFEMPTQNQYQYYLEGFDKRWSNWTFESLKNYTNLPEGDYTFRLKAKNLYGVVGTEATFGFSIAPPWYRSLMAYILYVLMISGGLYGAFRWNTQKLRQRQKLLEEQVKERTKKISRQKLEIEDQAKELRQKNEQLRALGNYKEAITGMIVHDLKNPLGAIIGLAESVNPIDQGKRIIQAGNNMLSLVMNILDVQKFEEAKMELKWGQYNLKALIELSIKRISLLKEEKNIQLNVNIHSQHYFKGDKDLLIRVFENLLSNAIKFTPVNKNIHIYNEPTEDSKWLKVIIEDEGPGMADHQIPEIFAKFGQLQQKSAGRARSTGLGLSFCKLAVEAHGGAIGVDSSAGKGAAFWFTLPKTEVKEKEEVKALEVEQSLPQLDSFVLAISELSTEEKAWFIPLVKSISTYKVFHISEILKLLQKIPAKASEPTLRWKAELEQTLYTSNSKRFTELIQSAMTEES